MSSKGIRIWLENDGQQRGVERIIFEKKKQIYSYHYNCGYKKNDGCKLKHLTKENLLYVLYIYCIGKSW